MAEEAFRVEADAGLFGDEVAGKGPTNATAAPSAALPSACAASPTLATMKATFRPC